MKKQNNYLFLSGLFFVAFLVVEFTDIYAPPIWFKAFVIILCITFFISSLERKIKNNN